jgi:hypothetical protein
MDQGIDLFSTQANTDRALPCIHVEFMRDDGLVARIVWIADDGLKDSDDVLA